MCTGFMLSSKLLAKALDYPVPRAFTVFNSAEASIPCVTTRTPSQIHGLQVIRSEGVRSSL